ncbi:MAG: hypothetical protein WCY41_06320 [Candidatus Micrarchaeia archaeon]
MQKNKLTMIAAAAVIAVTVGMAKPSFAQNMRPKVENGYNIMPKDMPKNETGKKGVAAMMQSDSAQRHTTLAKEAFARKDFQKAISEGKSALSAAKEDAGSLLNCAEACWIISKAYRKLHDKENARLYRELGAAYNDCYHKLTGTPVTGGSIYN